MPITKFKANLVVSIAIEVAPFIAIKKYLLRLETKPTYFLTNTNNYATISALIKANKFIKKLNSIYKKIYT